MLKKSKAIFLSIAAVGLMTSSVTALADYFSDAVVNKEECPVNAYPGTPYSGYPASIASRRQSLALARRPITMFEKS